jgi:hypothetical protein
MNSKNSDKNFDIPAIKELYRELKKARMILKWEEFADKIGYDRTYVSRVINGHEPLTQDLIDKIKNTFPNGTKNVPRGTLSDPLPPGGIVRTLKDYVEKIERDNEFLQNMMETYLKALVVNSGVQPGKVSGSAPSTTERTFEQLDKGVNDFVSTEEEHDFSEKPSKKSVGHK